MPVVPSPSLLTDVVGALRAAGCVFAEDEAELLMAAAESEPELIAMVERRCSGLPLEQVVGWSDFCGVRIRLEPGVFVPRVRTGLLVAQATAVVGPGSVVVDMCCGSGAVGVAVVTRAGAGELHAADVDPAAARCAAVNVGAVGGTVYQGDLFDPLPGRLRGRVDVLVVNAPYVPTAEIRLLPPEARDHEPRVTLDGGPDGLDVQRRVLAAASPWLAPAATVLVETGERQAPATAEILASIGLATGVVHDDDLSATVVVGTRAPARAFPPCR